MNELRTASSDARRTSRRVVVPAALAVLVSIIVRPADAGAARIPSTPRTPIQHVVVIVQENHSFDSYFANYCRTHRSGGKEACNGGPRAEPSSGTPATALDDAANSAHDPNHSRACEEAEIDGGKMDGFLSAAPVQGTCGAPYNFAYAPTGASSPVAYYEGLASTGAIADRYFQPVVGASSANDMYFWTTRFVFNDDDVEPDAVGKECSTTTNVQRFDDTNGSSNQNLGRVLTNAGVSWAWYAERYGATRDAGPSCPAPPADCPIASRILPCVFEPADIPAEYYTSSVDRPTDVRDHTELQTDIRRGSLPSVAFVKPVWYHNEHPGFGTTISAGVAFVHQTIDMIEHSKLAAHTLVLVTWDESGGYYDHVAPPPPSTVDHQPYGPRVALIATGPFARHGAVSHQLLEHSSITKFIEWNWLGKTGQLHGRDLTVHNLGSLLLADLRVPT